MMPPDQATVESPNILGAERKIKVYTATNAHRVQYLWLVWVRTQRAGGTMCCQAKTEVSSVHGTLIAFPVLVIHRSGVVSPSLQPNRPMVC